MAMGAITVAVWLLSSYGSSGKQGTMPV
jgi:hypothetical protein